MVLFPITLTHNEIGVQKVVDTVDELVAFLVSQNPYLWGGWSQYAHDPDIAAALQAANLTPADGDGSGA